MSQFNPGNLTWKASNHYKITPKYTIPQISTTLPISIDLTPNFTFPVYNQGEIGSCTANALAAAVQFDRLKANETPAFEPSRLFIYYNERLIENDVAIDAGANLSDGVKSLAEQGVCSEELWPYIDTAPTNEQTEAFPLGSKPVTKPSHLAYQNAINYKITSYSAVLQDIDHIKTILASGFPIIFGITLFNSWVNVDQPATIIPMPLSNDQEAGGHAILMVGYDDTKQLVKFRNSWGKEVGDNGYFFLHYDYILDPNLASDFWVINMVAH
jgi:C1A family cysteine protease